MKKTILKFASICLLMNSCIKHDNISSPATTTTKQIKSVHVQEQYGQSAPNRMDQNFNIEYTNNAINKITVTDVGSSNSEVFTLSHPTSSTFLFEGKVGASLTQNISGSFDANGILSLRYYYPANSIITTLTTENNIREFTFSYDNSSHNLLTINYKDYILVLSGNTFDSYTYYYAWNNNNLDSSYSTYLSTVPTPNKTVAINKFKNYLTTENCLKNLPIELKAFMGCRGGGFCPNPTTLNLFNPCGPWMYSKYLVKACDVAYPYTQPTTVAPYYNFYGYGDVYGYTTDANGNITNAWPNTVINGDVAYSYDFTWQ